MVRDGAARLLTMRVWPSRRLLRPHPEERALRASRRMRRVKTAGTTPHSRGTKCPGDASFVSLEKMEGAGKTGCWPHPWPRLQQKTQAAVTTGTPTHAGGLDGASKHPPSSCMDGPLSARAFLVFVQMNRGAVMYTALRCGH